jgi:hypothetical protein
MDGIDTARCDLADDLEQILSVHADGMLDLSPASQRWLLAALDELALEPGEMLLG